MSQGPTMPGLGRGSGIVIPTTSLLQELLTRVEALESRSLHVLVSNGVSPKQEGGEKIAEANFTSKGGRIWVYFGATGYAATVGTYAFYLRIDGVQEGEAFMFINVTSSHTTFLPVWVSLGTVAAGVHTIALFASGSLKTDTNDRYTLAYLEG